MKPALVAAALVVIAASAQAQTSQEADAKPADSVRPDAVISAVTIDLNGDGGFDRAVLVEGENSADLYIYLARSTSSGDDQRELALFKKEAAWVGGMWGTLPSLEVSPKGSLLLESGNDAVGRSRWTKTLTIVYRDSKFMVAGMTFSNRDTLAPNSAISCDLNLLTGQGTRNGKRVTTSLKAVQLSDWNDDTIPRECQ